MLLLAYHQLTNIIMYISIALAYYMDILQRLQ